MLLYPNLTGTLVTSEPKVRTIKVSGNVTVSPSDYMVVINKTSGQATTVILPAGPYVGEIHIIKDGKGDANTNNIRITTNASALNIDGAVNYSMSANYQAATLVFTATQWSVI